MKNILIVLIFVISTLSAVESYTLKLYEQVLPAIFKTKPLHVYADEESKAILKHSAVFKIVDDCSRADLIIGKKFENPDCQEKPFFATGYRSYQECKNCIGAFYWRKNRPQVRFNSGVINRFNLFLPENLQKYAK